MKTLQPSTSAGIKWHVGTGKDTPIHRGKILLAVKLINNLVSFEASCDLKVR